MVALNDLTPEERLMLDILSDGEVSDGEMSKTEMLRKFDEELSRADGDATAALNHRLKAPRILGH
jgi:hypothetical protein